MTKVYAYAFGLCAALTMVSCTKEESDQAAPPSLSAKEKLLTAKNWRLSAMSTVAKFNGITDSLDTYANIGNCSRDNFTKYTDDKVVTYDEGEEICYPNTPQTQTATWSFNTNETELTVVGTIDGSNQEIKSTLLQLTATTMQLRTIIVQTHQDVVVTIRNTSTYTAF